ncbi:MAG: VOC family protein, partial [Alphaproteobacteria bacterium]|nr:VOC family protein [Alphaproteobacteria bacterium]
MAAQAAARLQLAAMAEAPSFALLGLDHVVVRARDIERLIAFYRDGLGCTVERRRPDLGLVHLRAGRSFIDLVDVAGPIGRKGGAAPGP